MADKKTDKTSVEKIPWDPNAPIPVNAYLKKTVKQIDWKRLFFLLLGIVLFTTFYCSGKWPDAVDPQGKSFPLTREGQGAIALFLLAATWWVFEVLPIGVTSITIGVVQVLFALRDDEIVFGNFMAPSVWFIFASITIGLVFTKTGLTKRMAYKMLVVVGERTSMIYLGCFTMTAALTLIMAHTAVAATIFPLLMAIYALYGEEDKPTKFGKGLFMGMAFTAGAGSIITLLGAARGPVAIGFFNDITGRDISFFQLTYYMFPIGWLMVFLLWGFFMVFYKPEKARIPGLRERAKSLYSRLGPVTFNEILAVIIVFCTVAALGFRSFIPVLEPINKSAIILLSTILFFIFRILTVEDLEQVPWNIILLFGGAMCIGYCLDQTEAAEWLAVNWLAMFQNAHWFVFVLGIAFFVLVMTNVIMNVAAIAITIPVAIVIAKYLGVTPEIVIFASLVTAGMPFLFLVGAAPNAIAYESKQFSSTEFMLAGIPASILLMIVLAFFIWFIWPVMGMPIVVPQ